MLKYLISPTSELTTDYIGKAIMDFQTRQLPTLNKLWNYYVGKQKITKKQVSHVNKPNNTPMTNFCNEIVKVYNGYLTGLPITYSNDDFQNIVDILMYNDVGQEDNEYLRSALIYGRAFECNYLDEEGKQRFKLFNTKECLPIYSNTLNGDLLYVIRFYQESMLENQEGQDNYIVEVYGPDVVRKYRSTPGFASFTLVDEYPHFFGQCPVTVFSLNADEESIFYQIISLQDNYNTVLANGVNDHEVWSDAYLVFKGTNIDFDSVLSFKEDRVMSMDSDASVEYLTKDETKAQTMELLEVLRRNIFNISNCPDFQDEKFMAQSGEAIKYKLVGFENIAAGIETYMRKALQRRIELISSILHLTLDEQEWRDVDIRFTRNLPSNLMPITVSELMQYKGLVSDETLLGLVPFIKDPLDELKKVDEQEQKELEMVEFGHYGQMDSEAEEDTK